jgi:cytosine/adenosine deaminase-related metal-dependent hydrolase
MPRFLIHSDVIADYRGILASPGAILIDGNRIEAIGSPQDIGHPSDVPVVKIDGLVTPSFVNAHAHLDLSGLGNVAFSDSFIEWLIEVVRPIRIDPARIQSDVRKGIKLSLDGGCNVVGDIAGTIEAAEIVKESELISVSYVEIIGSGKNSGEAIKKVNEIPNQFEVTPHAPYSCSKEVYEACFSTGKKIATHLSESLSEIEFAQNRGGDFVEAMKRMGVWEESIKPYGKHPIDAILEIAGNAEFVSAHLNYVDDNHLELVSESNMSVAYCPRASEYFGHKNHRWKEMLDCGINVALGTDSLLCLDTPDRISVLDEMKLLYRRDGGEPNTLFAMASVNGAIALGLDPQLVSLSEGENAGLLGFDGLNSLQEVLISEVPPKWITPQHKIN